MTEETSRQIELWYCNQCLCCTASDIVHCQKGEREKCGFGKELSALLDRVEAEHREDLLKREEAK